MTDLTWLLSKNSVQHSDISCPEKYKRSNVLKKILPTVAGLQIIELMPLEYLTYSFKCRINHFYEG